ncbi:MAG: transposase [Sandaracinaceae bacterium]|nr:transposase [Sandaracinaceae bacterium]
MHALLHRDTSRGYERRRPEQTVLYRVLAEHWPAFRAQAQEAGGLPRFVEREVEGYLRCGLLEHGFVRVACKRCGLEHRVAFSCKGRAFCPSCLGRRMSDGAAHLVDRVLPEVAVRQWVCSLPWSLRVAAAYDRDLAGALIDAFASALEGSMRARAKRLLGLRSAHGLQTGSVTVVQRTDASLRLNWHLHVLMLDGVYVRQDGGEARLERLDEPALEEVSDVAERMGHRARRRLAKLGRVLDEQGACESGEPFTEDQLVLAQCASASAGALELSGPRAGQPLLRIVGEPPETAPRKLAAQAGGFDVHASAAVDGRDRKRLEHLCRYLLRPPLARERIELREDGRVVVRFRKPWRDGTRAVVMSPMDLCARLCALVPPPRSHLVRYHGVGSGIPPRCSTVCPVRLRFEHDLRSEGHGLAAATSPPPVPPDRSAKSLKSHDRLRGLLLAVPDRRDGTGHRGAGRDGGAHPAHQLPQGVPRALAPGRRPGVVVLPRARAAGDGGGRPPVDAGHQPPPHRGDRDEGELPELKRRLHGEFSKALNALMAELRYDQPHQVWDDRGTHAGIGDPSEVLESPPSALAVRA